MRRVSLLVLAMGIFTVSFAQTGDQVFQFDYMADKLDLSGLSNEFSYSHFMGEQIGKKLHLLRESYTWKADPTPTSPTPWTVTEKPSIYNNVKKLEKYYKKSIKKGAIVEAEAIEEFERIIDIALLVRYQATENLEAHLEQLKEEEEIVSVFSKKVQVKYY